MPGNRNLSRLSNIWSKNLMISCFLLFIVYTSHDIASVTRRIAAEMIDIDSNSKLKTRRQSIDDATTTELKKSNNSHSAKINGLDSSPSPQFKSLKSPITCPRSSRKLGGHREVKGEFDCHIDHGPYKGDATKVASLETKDERLGPDVPRVKWEMPKTRLLPLSGLSKDGDEGDTRGSSLQSSNELCEYKVVTVTGKQDGAGTASDISISLSNFQEEQVVFRRLKNGHRTFERGHTDTFVLQGYPCVDNICRIVLHTDDYGDFSEWFVVRVTIFVLKLQPPTGQPLELQQKDWEIDEWLPKEDEAHELFTVRDDCPSSW